MTTRRNTRHQPEDAFALGATPTRTDAFPARRELPKRAAIASGVLLGMLTLSMVLSSCGRGAARSGSVETPVSAVSTVPIEPSSSQTAIELASSSPAASDTTGETLPPDLAATVMDTRVQPGQSVEIYVEATPDVVEMTLWDGLNDKQSLVYDAEAKVWHGTYRVPLAIPRERVGLSVTARNDASRWRRVWVFLNVVHEGADSEGEVGDADPGC